MTLSRTNQTAPVRGLPDYTFDRVQYVTFDGMVTAHGWVNTRTGDYATKFRTKAEAVANAKRFDKGLREEEAGVEHTRQFADAPQAWLEAELARVIAQPEKTPYRAGLETGYRVLLAQRPGYESEMR